MRCFTGAGPTRGTKNSQEQILIVKSSSPGPRFGKARTNLIRLNGGCAFNGQDLGAMPLQPPRGSQFKGLKSPIRRSWQKQTPVWAQEHRPARNAAPGATQAQVQRGLVGSRSSSHDFLQHTAFDRSPSCGCHSRFRAGVPAWVKRLGPAGGQKRPGPFTSTPSVLPHGGMS